MLAPEAFEQGSDVDEAARELKRFIVGDGQGQGYVFSHPKLNEYFADLLMEKREQRAWHQRFLRFGENNRPFAS